MQTVLKRPINFKMELIYPYQYSYSKYFFITCFVLRFRHRPSSLISVIISSKQVVYLIMWIAHIIIHMKSFVNCIFLISLFCCCLYIIYFLYSILSYNWFFFMGIFFIVIFLPLFCCFIPFSLLRKSKLRASAKSQLPWLTPQQAIFIILML